MYYNEHRSWYSFVISTLTSFVYAFGFIQLMYVLLCPSTATLLVLTPALPVQSPTHVRASNYYFPLLF